MAAEDPCVTEPVVGWRLWSLREGALESWAMDYRWDPGENVASCLDPGRRRCGSPPGVDCRCGFWGVWRPSLCVVRACVAPEPPWHVMGLIAGWGRVAMHGSEGFRAERAALRCLFVDRLWSVPPPAAGEPRPADGPLAAAEAAADRYGVPLVSVRDASGLGLLLELGVPDRHIAEAVRLADRRAELLAL